MTLAEETRRFFAPGGALSRAVRGYEERPSQARMAEAVAAAIDRGGRLLAEAGTGTGKTLAYLVPAVLSGRKVIVSTATRHLQEQVALSDAALVARASGRRFSTVLLKGRGNYLCRRRLALAPALAPHGTERLILDWAARTATGDRAECADVPENDPAWGTFASDADDCMGRRCRLQKACFLEGAKAKAAEADIVVVNHHLFFADLAIRAASQDEAAVLPPYDTVIFDEAHAVEDVAGAHFGRGVESAAIEQACKAAAGLRKRRARGAGAMNDAVDRLRTAAGEFFREFGGGGARGAGASLRFDAGTIPGEAHGRHLSLDDALDRVAAAVRAVAQGKDAPAQADALLARLSALRTSLAFVMEARAPGYVFYAETDGVRTRLNAFPLDVGGILQTVLYPGLHAAVFTSATLATGGNLSYIADRLGLAGAVVDGTGRAIAGGERADEVVLPAPFDYARQACLFVPDGLPEPNDARFTREAIGVIERLTGITAGRAFVLCTSRRQMDAYHAALREKLPYDVYRQGDLPKTAILDRFRGGRPGVLFATASFWEGVDVPGDALSLVIMDRIPFSPPDEPTTQARIEKLREAGRDPWSEFQLPQATLALKQGFGRLIRARSDRGIVAVLDTRLLSKGYGKYILKSLPELSVFTDTGAVRKWWDGRR